MSPHPADGNVPVNLRPVPAEPDAPVPSPPRRRPCTQSTGLRAPGSAATFSEC
jgi:hypothetical protein